MNTKNYNRTINRKLEFAKIYRIINFKNNKIYIGGTCARLLCIRMSKHRANKESHLHRSIGDIKDCKIELLEEVVVNDIYEFRNIEREYIQKAWASNEFECINKNLPNNKIRRNIKNNS